MKEHGQAWYESPLGPIEIKSIDTRICQLNFHNSLDSTLIESTTMSSVILQCIRELEEYFNHRRTRFDVAIEMEGTDFEKEVWSNLIQIPSGKTKSYKKVAVDLGDTNKVRAVGGAANRNKIPIIIPCHRVIGEDGGLVGYAGGIERKKWLLEHEGALLHQLNIF